MQLLTIAVYCGTMFSHCQFAPHTGTGTSESKSFSALVLVWKLAVADISISTAVELKLQRHTEGGTRIQTSTQQKLKFIKINVLGDKSPNNSIELCGHVRKGAGSIRESFEWKTCQTRLPKLRWGEQVRKVVIQKVVSKGRN
jgi:hypothetical protein